MIRYEVVYDLATSAVLGRSVRTGYRRRVTQEEHAAAVRMVAYVHAYNDGATWGAVRDLYRDLTPAERELARRLLVWIGRRLWAWLRSRDWGRPFHRTNKPRTSDG